MTLPGGRGAAGGDPDAERVLSQALRAMAGGGRPAGPTPEPEPSRIALTGLQILLIATIAGLLIGMTIGVISLLG